MGGWVWMNLDDVPHIILSYPTLDFTDIDYSKTNIFYKEEDTFLGFVCRYK